MEKLKRVRDALLNVTKETYHYYKKSGGKDKYIVWAEESEATSFYSDDKKNIQVIQGSIDYYTLKEFDENIERIQQELTRANIAYRLNSVQYEDETKLIHYEWIFEVS